MKNHVFLAAITLVLFGCKSEKIQDTSTNVFSDYAFLEDKIVTLSSDAFFGRKPFTEGETITINYLAEQYKALGLEPVFGDSYFQDVPCVYMDYMCEERVGIKGKNGNVALKRNEDIILQTPHLKKEVALENSELVFAGYGIVAPEYGRNDYEGIDVKGKTVLVLVNDPGYSTQDDQVFRGNAMTYYGRWTYKYEEAARQGAAGVLVIHSTDAAGYSFKVLTNTAASRIYLQSEDNNLSRCTLTGWITEDALSKVFQSNGLDFAAAKKKSLDKDFKAFGLGSDISVHFENTLTYKNSKNVVGMIKGTERPDENIVYSAHWDHFGIGPKQGQDSIYNGAADNGTAVSAMLLTAKAFGEGDKPKRTVVFNAVTAEESGMLGSKYYAEHNPFTNPKTVANLNYELLLPIGRMKDVTITGFGQSELEKYVEEEAQKQDRYIVEEPFPENGMYYRSDHFSFARYGVPSLFVKGWQDSRAHGKEWAKSKIQEYWATKYHKPADEYDAKTANLEGIAEDAELFYNIGNRLANESTFPNWYKTSEFRAIRDASIKN